MASANRPNDYDTNNNIYVSPFNKDILVNKATYDIEKKQIKQITDNFNYQKKQLEDEIQRYKNNINKFESDRALLSKGSPNYERDFKALTDKIELEKKRLSQAQNQLQVLTASYNNRFKPKTPVTTPGANSVGVKPSDDARKPPFIYKYNAPMVKSAYILNRPSKEGDFNNPQVESTPNDKLITSPAMYKKDAKEEAWKSNGDGIAGSKGVIQMSSWLAARTKLSSNPKKDKYFSNQMYGFKFLYNPTTVAMSWGVNTEVNFQLESLGLDKSVPLTGGLSGSTISFDLLLNRIGDMANLTEFGLKTLNQGNVSGQTGAKIQNPYPTEVDDEELQLIYKKGTMYDLEYLFKSINGYNASYVSDTNGLTADRGWLFALPVELLLGDGLRYLVRITSMSVTHDMFNERMVPIRSLVNLTCTRFYDGSALADFVKTSA